MAYARRRTSRAGGRRVQVTPEFVRAALCEPPVEVPAEPGGLLPVGPEPSGW